MSSSVPATSKDPHSLSGSGGGSTGGSTVGIASSLQSLFKDYATQPSVQPGEATSLLLQGATYTTAPLSSGSSDMASGKSPSSSGDTASPIILDRHDSEFSVGSDYDDGSPRNLNVWQGALLLTADCLGTGILALPGDIKVLGALVGFTFLIANLPINLYAGTILSLSASAVERKQVLANRVYQSAGLSSGLLSIGRDTATGSAMVLCDDGVHGNNNTGKDQKQQIEPSYRAVNTDTISSTDTEHSHSQLHHDTATSDFIGMTQALFNDHAATRWVVVIYYTNIFLVLGNYILVMSHAVTAAIGEDRICLPTAGLIASAGMLVLSSQARTMAKLGRTASIASLSALLVVILQCLWELQQQQQQEHQLLHPQMPLQLQQQKQEDQQEQQHPSIWRQFSAMGSIGFAVGSQKLFLNIRHELADRDVAPRSLCMSLTAFGAFYVLVTLAAGPNPPSFLLDAVPAETWNRRVAGLLLWAHVVVSYAINSQAICSSLDRLFYHHGGGTGNQGAFWQWLDELRHSASPALLWFVLTVTMAVTAYLVANAIPFFKDLVALIGAVTSVPLTLLLPALFWRKHLSVPLWIPTWHTMSSYTLLLFSLAFVIVATIGVLTSIQRDWAHHGPPFSCH